MLALKKISAKKLATYVSLIALMLGGTGFMLYQNKRLTSPKPLIIDNPAQFENLAPSAESPAAASATAKNLSQSAGRPSAISKLKNSGGLDLSIFTSEKFKALKDNILTPAEPPGIGKRNPFAPE